MRIPPPQKALVVFIDLTDTWKERKLFEAIVGVLDRNHIEGATVMSGIMGYGVHRQIHRKGLFGISDEKPVTIVAVDTEEKIRAVLPKIVPMVKEGLIMLQDAEVISTGLRDHVEKPSIF
jgi:PII-like signaling protein